MPRANIVTEILNIRYEIWQVGGGNTGIGRTLNFGSDWRLAEGGIETGCGAPFWEAYDSQANTYEFIGNNFQIPVQSLASGDYYGKFIGQNTKCENINNFDDCSTVNFDDAPGFFTFAITAPATINVSSNIYTGWTISGTENFGPNYGTTASYSKQAGTYSITADEQYCYSKSINNSTQSVSAGGTITFTITYTNSCPPPPPPPPPGAPTVDLKFNGSNGPVSDFPSGSAGTLSWTVSNADACTASGGTSNWSSPSSKVATDGTWSQSSGAITSSQTFSISCTGDGGTANDSVQVSIAGQPPPPTPPTVDLKFNGSDGPVSNFTSGTSGTLSWTVSNAASCSSSGGTSSWNSPASKSTSGGSQSSGAITSSLTFNISCIGAGGSASDSVSVNLSSNPQTCTDPAATNYGGPLPCTYTGGSTSCSVSTNPYPISNFPKNNVDVTVLVGGWDGQAHEYNIDCTDDGSYEETTYVTWTPYTFKNACDYSGPATLRARVRNLSTQVTAQCTTPISGSNRTLTTSIASGSGTITGSGISCPGDCSEVYANNTNVTLTAAPSANYIFAGWSGACSGLSSCSVLMDQNRSVTASFNYTPFDYSLSNSGNSSVTKTSGNAYTQNVITKTLLSGASQSVSLTLSGVPGGTSYSFSNGACSPGCSSTVTFTVTPSTPAGTYPVVVTGSPLNRTTSFNLIISGAPISVSCLASPQTALLGQNVTWTATVSGGTAPLTYSWSGTGIPTSPAPSTNPYTRTYSTVGLKSAQATVIDSDSIQSTCPAATVQINFNPEFEEF